MTSLTATVPDLLEMRCTKCRRPTRHVRVAGAAAAPERVRCSVCQQLAAVRKTGPRAAADPRKAAREEWDALRPGMDASRARDYSMTTAYRIRALINHPLFGLGLVQQLTGPQKMVVLFADGRKTMRCK